MNIEIDYSTACDVMVAVMLEDYRNLKSGWMDEDTGMHTKEQLLQAYRVVIDYCATEQQKVGMDDD